MSPITQIWLDVAVATLGSSGIELLEDVLN